MALPDPAAAQRRLAAILSADIVGYSRLMQADDRATHQALLEIRALVARQVAATDGRIVNMAGDAVLAEFASVVNATNCALEIQRDIARRNAPLLADRQMQLRIGVNVGDVLADGEGIYGDGVNVAARLESLCAPGCVAISGAAYEQVRDKLELPVTDRGAQSVKNINRPVRVYEIAPTGSVARPRSATAARRGRLVLAGSAVFLVVAIVSVLAVRTLIERKSQAEQRPFKSVAVLPLAAEPPAKDGAELAERLTRDLTSAMTHAIHDGVVMSYGLVRQYGGKSHDPRLAGRDLNVRFIVDGTLGETTGSHRLDLEAIDTISGARIWAESVQWSGPENTKAIGQLSNGLRRAIADASAKDVLELPEPRRSAWQLVLQAWDRGISLTDIEEGQRIYEKALRIDPDLDAALLGLGAMLNVALQNEPENREQLIRRMDEVTARAIRVAPKNPRSWLQRSQALRWQGNWSGAFAATDEAMRIDPYRARSLIIRAEVLMTSGRPAEALPLIQQAHELDAGELPMAMAYSCVALMLLQRDAEALPRCESAAMLFEFWTMPMLATAAHANLGNDQQVAVWKQRLLRSNPKITLERLRAIPYSSHPAYVQQLEHALDGLRRAGIPEK